MVLSSERKIWVMTSMALVGSVFLYGLIAHIVASGRDGINPPNENLTTTLFFLGAAVLMISIAYFRRQTRGYLAPSQKSKPEALPGSQEFFKVSIVSMALAEVPSIYGLLLVFMGAGTDLYWFFAAGSLIVMLLLVYPGGMKYWMLREQEERER